MAASPKCVSHGGFLSPRALYPTVTKHSCLDAQGSDFSTSHHPHLDGQVRMQGCIPTPSPLPPQPARHPVSILGGKSSSETRHQQETSPSHRTGLWGAGGALEKPCPSPTGPSLQGGGALLSCRTRANTLSSAARPDTRGGPLGKGCASASRHSTRSTRILLVTTCCVSPQLACTPEQQQ